MKWLGVKNMPDFDEFWGMTAAWLFFGGIPLILYFLLAARIFGFRPFSN